jgi:hypothetical protein
LNGFKGKRQVFFERFWVSFSPLLGKSVMISGMMPVAVATAI